MARDRLDKLAGAAVAILTTLGMALLILAFALLVAGCGILRDLPPIVINCPPSPSPTPTVAPTTPPTPVPSPTPVPTPTPEPSPSATPAPPCPAIAAMGGQVAQFQLQHRTVAKRQVDQNTWEALGPFDRVNFDATVYYGCAAPRCDSEHDPSLARCEDLRGPRYRVVAGPCRNPEPGNPGDDGRGFAYACDVSPGDEGAVEVCTVVPWVSTETGEHVGGMACKTIQWRAAR